MNSQETFSVTELWLLIPGNRDVGDSGRTEVMTLPCEVELSLLQVRSLCEAVQSALQSYCDPDIHVTAQAIEEAYAISERLVDDYTIQIPNVGIADDNECYDFIADDFAFDSARERL